MANLLDLLPLIRKGRKAKAVSGWYENDIASWENGQFVATEKNERNRYKELTDGMVDRTDWELVPPEWKSCTQDEVWDLPEGVEIETRVKDESHWDDWRRVERVLSNERMTYAGLVSQIPLDRTRQFRWREKE